MTQNGITAWSVQRYINVVLIYNYFGILCNKNAQILVINHSQLIFRVL